jgi:hypothetical protein
VLEHERSQRQHRGADLLALRDVARALRALDEIVDEGVDPPGAAVAEDRELALREIVRTQDAVAKRVVDVVVDVSDPVDAIPVVSSVCVMRVR